MSRVHNYPNVRQNANLQLPFHFQAPQNGNYSTNYPMVPVERGPVAMRNNNHDFFHNQWGVPDDLAQMMQTNPNIQPMDLIAQYKGRALVIPSQHITAALLNAEASFLSEVVAPMFPTTEFNFESSYREMNMVEFTRIAAGGVPNQQTFSTTAWRDTMQKMQLDAQIELQYALDPLLGEKEWLFQLAGMANNAMLTIHKTIGYAVVSIGYGNILGEYVKKGPGNIAKLLMLTEDYFAIAARDAVKYLNMIRRFAHLIPGMDLVLTEFGTAVYSTELLGESESMRGQKTILDPTTGDLMWRFTQGKKSIATMNYGELKIHFAEIPNLRVNMKDDNHEQPLRTSVTLAEVYPPNPDNKATDFIVPRAANLDIEIYRQGKTQGDMVKVSIVDAYNACFYWGKDGKISPWTKQFCVEKNAQISGNDALIPWEYNALNNMKDKDLMDFNADSPYDNDTPNIDYIRGKETLEAMKGWRERFFGVTYVAALRRFVVPKRIGDFEQWAIPNNRILQCAKTIAAVAASDNRVDFNGMINETHDLLDEIDAVPFTKAYLDALRQPQLNKIGLSSFARDPARSPYKKAAKLREWAANENGSMNIPLRENGGNNMDHPAGFGFGGGLVTYAKLADGESGWKEGAIRAKKVVMFWEGVGNTIEQYVGDSDFINPSLTHPAFQVESRITVMIDSIRHHTAPVFLSTLGKVAPLEDIKEKMYLILDAFKPAVSTLITPLSTALKTVAKDGSNAAKDLLDSILNHVEKVVINPFLNNPGATNYVKQLASIVYVATSLALLVQAAIATNTSKDNEIATLANEFQMFMAPTKGSIENTKALYEKKVKAAYEPTGTGLTDKTKAVNDILDGIANPKALGGEKREWARAPLVIGRHIFAKGLEDEIVAADPHTFYESKYDASKGERNDLIHRAFGATTKFNRNLSFGLGGLPYSQIYQCQTRGLNARGGGGGDDFQQKKSSFGSPQGEAGRTDIFAESLLSKKTRTSRAMNYDEFLAGPSGNGFGAPRDYNDLEMEDTSSSKYDRNERRDVYATQRKTKEDFDEAFKPANYSKLSPVDRKKLDKEMDDFLTTQEFVGPWQGRFNYMNKTVHSPIHKVIFMAILMAPNTVEIHTRLASIGLKLINVLIFRLFIQHIMSSTIVMQSLTSIEAAISRTTVFSSMEKRGIITINGGFYLGMIRRNPQNIQMMPYTHPVGFVGGMGTDFIRVPSHFRNKVNEKASMIALPSPITESVYEYPLHFLGMPTFTRKDRDNTPHYRKWSSCEFAKFVFGDTTLYDAESHIKEHKMQHGFSYDVSFCVARGCVRYVDASNPSHSIKMVAGTGARGDPCMNSTTAWKTFMGDSIKFPEYAYDHTLRV